MSEFGGSGVVNGRWDGREPIFRDVPLEQSEWATLHAMLTQVNTLKAELVRVQYEATRTAYQNYHTTVEHELARYNQQRAIDAEYNAQIRAYRAQLLSQVEEIRQRWQPELDALRRQLDEARLRAYRLAARAGVQLREDPEAGLEIVNPSQSTGAPPQEPVSSETRSDSPPFVARLWQRLPQQTTSPPAPTPTTALAMPSVPLTPEEAAYAQRLPTNHAPATPLWLPWVAAVAVGLALGQILLAAIGHPLSAWQSLAFWIASIAGVLVGVMWYRVVWSLSRALTELHYLYWEAQKARRAAWLGGGVLIVVLLLPTLTLLTAIGRLPATGAADVFLLAMLTIVLIIPLLGLALVGGYFYGRAAVVHNAIQSKVTAALREQRRAEHAQARGATVASEPSEENHSPRGANGEIEESAPKSPSNHLAPPPPSEPSCLPPLLADVREAVAEVRAQHKAYLRLQAMRQEELLPYERLLNEMQPRPMYDYLPPQAEQRVQALYRQWLNAYTTFLDYVGEAVRECKDGEQLQQRISEFKQTLLR